jgi:hypothetical protein
MLPTADCRVTARCLFRWWTPVHMHQRATLELCRTARQPMLPLRPQTVRTATPTPEAAHARHIGDANAQQASYAANQANGPPPAPEVPVGRAQAHLLLLQRLVQKSLQQPGVLRTQSVWRSLV